jgi:hypothetical protein
MGIRLSLGLFVALTLSGCKDSGSGSAPAVQDGKPAAAGGVVRVSTAPPSGFPPGDHPPTAKSALATRPNCGGTQTAVFLGGKDWRCAFNPWKGLKKGSTHEKCDGNAPPCNHSQSPACGRDRSWFCYDPKAQDAQ